MRDFHLPRRGAGDQPRGRLAGEAGSFLIETMVSAVIVLIAGAGVLNMMDRGSELSGQQKGLATAAALAQSEQETLRGYAQTKEGMAFLTNLRRSPPSLPPRTVAGVPYSITSRTDWVDDDSGEPNCTTDAVTPDYLKLTTTVTFPAIGNRPPVILESLIAPPARVFEPDQGSLAVDVVDRSGGPISALTMSLSGPATLSDATNANGCVLWGYLPAGSGYTVSASRAGYVQPDASTTIAEPVTVVGDQTNNVNLEYDLAGGVSAEFTTKRSAAAAVTSTSPQKAMVEHANAAFIPTALPVTASALDSGLSLFPFTAAYSIYAGACAAAKPPSAANRGSAAAPRGSTSASVTVQIPALNILVRNNGANVPNAVVKVTSCGTGTAYTRSTLTDGTVNDPGFPYGTLAVCVSNGARKRQVASVANTTYPATNVTYDIATTGSTTGACP